MCCSPLRSRLMIGFLPVYYYFFSKAVHGDSPEVFSPDFQPTMRSIPSPRTKKGMTLLKSGARSEPSLGTPSRFALSVNHDILVPPPEAEDMLIHGKLKRSSKRALKDYGFIRSSV